MKQLKEEPKKSKEETPEKYRKIIQKYESDFKNWTTRGKEILKIYRDDDKVQIEGKAKRVWAQKSFNILWSNIQTMKPAYYSRTPQTLCERKFSDPDPVGKFAAEIAERVGDCLAKKPHYNDTIQSCVEDRLLPGRGSAWAKVETKFGDPLVDPETGEELQDESGKPILQPLSVEVVPEYVGWQDYGHQVVDHPSKIKIWWRKVEFDKTAAKERFGDKEIDFDRTDDEKSDTKENDERTACIIELCDKNTGKWYWFQESGEEFLDTKPDIFGLSTFVPSPRPLYATLTTNSLIPVADYCYYQELAEQLNEAVDRRRLIISAVRVVGAYNAAHADLKRMVKESAENEMIGIKDWESFSAGGGVRGSTDFLPIEPLVKVLQVLTGEIAQLKSEIYEITGISDIIRGNTSPNETATAQQLKGQFATLRISPGQRDVQRFAEDLLVILIELALEHMPDEQIAQMINLASFPPETQQLFPEALQILRDDKQREYRVKIETDSMAAIDENGEAARVVEATDKLSQYMERALNNIAAMPMSAPIWKEGVMLLARTMRGGRAFEHSIEQAFNGIVQQAMQPPPPQEPPPPDPAMVKTQMDAQTKDREMALKERQQMVEEELKAYDLQLRQREMAVKEQELALKVEAEKHLQAMNAEKALLDIVSGGTGQGVASATAPAKESSSNAPLALTINIPNQSTKKRGAVVTDPITGIKTIQIEDVPEIAGS
jgi:hypothetical protein